MSDTARVSMILAVAQNGVIGRDGALPWHLPDDLKNFRAETMGKTVLMGRKTWESLPVVLDGRRCVVLASMPVSGDCTVLSGLDAVPALLADESEVVVMGGARVFDTFFPLCTRIVRTRIEAEVAGDVVLPTWSWESFAIVREEHHAADERHAYAFTVQELVRTSAVPDAAHNPN